MGVRGSHLAEGSVERPYFLAYLRTYLLTNLLTYLLTLRKDPLSVQCASTSRGTMSSGIESRPAAVGRNSKLGMTPSA